MPEQIDIDHLLNDIKQQLIARMQERSIKQPIMVGIHTGGAWIAERLHQQLALSIPLGVLDISFYRDDFTRVGLNPKVQSSSIPQSLEDQHVILVDDVVELIDGVVNGYGTLPGLIFV